MKITANPEANLSPTEEPPFGLERAAPAMWLDNRKYDDLPERIASYPV